MSAFLVADETINRVITQLVSNPNNYTRRIILNETGCDLKTRTGKADFGKAMYELNCAGVDARYGEGEHKTFRDSEYAGFKPVNGSAIQAYKSLCCFLYQCTEGDTPDTSLMYSTLQRVKAELADDIVTALPAYEAAEWTR